MKSYVFGYVLLAMILAMTGARANPSALSARYAILSLIGDSMTIVTYAPSVGSRIDKNQHESVPLTDPVFDQAAAKAIDDALRRIGTRSPPVLLAASSPSVFSEQRSFFDGSRVVLGDAMSASLKSAGATHLLLVTKHRGETRIDAHKGTESVGSVGSGYLEGIGFYIDRQLPTTRGDTRQQANGFLSPYVYAKVTLIDVASATVMQEEVVTASRFISAARSADSDPWAALCADQKAGLLRRLIVDELERVVPLLVSPKKT